MEEQALPDEGAVADCRELRVSVMSRPLAEGLERLERLGITLCGDFNKYQREIQSLKDMFKEMQEEQASWARERESMDGVLRKLRSEVEQLQAAAAAVSAAPQICDVDRGSEELDLKLLAEHKWNASRQALAPITPEAVRARTPFMKQGALGVSGVAMTGKENIYSDQKSGVGAEEIQRLRRENEHWKQKAGRLSKDYKGLKSQYNYLQTRLGSKADVGHLNLDRDNLQAALEASLEKPSKIRKRSCGEAQTQGGDARSPSPIFSDLNAPSTPVPDSGTVPPQVVAEVVTGLTASTSGSRDPQAKVVHFESFEAVTHLPLTRNKSAECLDAGLEGEPDQAVDNSAIPTPMARNRKRSLEPSGKQPAKSPAFKFVEPVRKKAERENLQGTECKLCKKFYDAVVAGDAQGMVESRCNHLDKSRHRFRDLPPATPEGFWNIGFDSDF